MRWHGSAVAPKLVESKPQEHLQVEPTLNPHFYQSRICIGGKEISEMHCRNIRDRASERHNARASSTDTAGTWNTLLESEESHCCIIRETLLELHRHIDGPSDTHSAVLYSLTDPQCVVLSLPWSNWKMLETISSNLWLCNEFCLCLLQEQW